MTDPKRKVGLRQSGRNGRVEAAGSRQLGRKGRVEAAGSRQSGRKGRVEAIGSGQSRLGQRQVGLRLSQSLALKVRPSKSTARSRGHNQGRAQGAAALGAGGGIIAAANVANVALGALIVRLALRAVAAILELLPLLAPVLDRPRRRGEALARGGLQRVGERRGARTPRQERGQQKSCDLGRQLSAEIAQSRRIQRRQGRGRTADSIGARRVCAQLRRRSRPTTVRQRGTGARGLLKTRPLLIF